MSSVDVIPWVSLSLVPGLGDATLRQLVAEFGSPQAVFDAPPALLSKTVAHENLVREIKQALNRDRVAPVLEWLKQPSHFVLPFTDPDYPKPLLEIPDPPPLLYGRGNKELLKQSCLAIVGSRSASPQGLDNAKPFAQYLGNDGLCIVSGMALGTDSAAHRGGLLTPAKSVGVLGAGVDVDYPVRNHDLATDMANQGVLISEHALGTPPMAQNFPRRNRIISGLSLGCLVVEAAMHSGSLITARLAAEQGREVFAIPGSIHSPLSKGCHALIKQGAKLVESAHDVLEELGWPAPPLNQPPTQTQETNAFLSCLGFDPVDIDTLTARCGLTSETVCAMLLQLELEGRVVCLPGNLYQRMR